jgi:hypothetical protein
VRKESRSTRRRRSRRGPGRFPGARRFSSATAAGGAFPPGRLFFHFGPENYSPALLRKISYLGGNAGSFEEAEKHLKEVLDFSICARHIQTLTERIGSELASQTARLAELWSDHSVPPSPLADAPECVAVAVDDGKLHTRGDSPGAGVHEPQWRNYKAAHLMTLRSAAHDRDPAPDPPAAFTDKTHVAQLVEELARVRSERPPSPAVAPGEGPAPSGAPPGKPPAKPLDTPAAAPPAKPSRQAHSPEIILRSFVVTHADPKQFAARVAAEAWQRRFFDAPRAAFLGDGSPGNWSIHDEYFPGFLPVLDFLHLLSYLVAGARKSEKTVDWPLYQRLVHLAWAGRPAELLRLLRRRARRFGHAPQDARSDDPRLLLAQSIAYLDANKLRMDYPRARRLGLPLTSSHVESLINTLNHRVKASGKFWRPRNVEAVLHVRAACLSDLPQWNNFWSARGASQRGLIRPRRAAA